MRAFEAFNSLDCHTVRNHYCHMTIVAWRYASLQDDFRNISRFDITGFGDIWHFLLSDCLYPSFIRPFPWTQNRQVCSDVFIYTVVHCVSQS